LRGRAEGGAVAMSWRGAGASKWAVQACYGGQWKTIAVVPAATTAVRVGALGGRLPERVAVSAVDRYGNSGKAAAVGSTSGEAD